MFKNRLSQNSQNAGDLELQEGISKGLKKLKIEAAGLGTHRKLPDRKLEEMGRLNWNKNS